MEESSHRLKEWMLKTKVSCQLIPNRFKKRWNINLLEEKRLKDIAGIKMVGEGVPKNLYVKSWEDRRGVLDQDFSEAVKNQKQNRRGMKDHGFRYNQMTPMVLFHGVRPTEFVVFEWKNVKVFVVQVLVPKSSRPQKVPERAEPLPRVERHRSVPGRETTSDGGQRRRIFWSLKPNRGGRLK